MTIEEMRNRKTQLGLTNEMISELSGIPLSTIQKIMSGATKAPRKVTLEAVEAVLYAEELRRQRSVIHRRTFAGTHERKRRRSQFVKHCF